MTPRIARVALIAALTSLAGYAWRAYQRHSLKEARKFDKTAVQEWETEGGNASGKAH